jgi:DNA (cytosine-5)-methyltransferase 1
VIEGGNWNLDERPWLLDVYCKAGGAARGYQRAGFHVVGIDHEPQPNYAGDVFIQADAIQFLERMVAGGTWEWKGPGLFAGVHASPPCQSSSSLRHLWKDRRHPEMIPATRELLVKLGKPYVLENVPGAALVEPFLLCGSMFGNGANGRQLRRHRLFETSFPVMVPMCQHRGQPVGVYGHGGGGAMTRGYKGTKAEYQEAMEMPWATKAEIAQAIPPSYTEHIGSYLLAAISQKAVA